MASPWTPGQLCDDLRRLGIEPGEVVMVHASLRAIGPVDGGAAGVVAALDEAVGPSGTLLMTLGARDDWSWVNEHAEDAREALLAGEFTSDVPWDDYYGPGSPLERLVEADGKVLRLGADENTLTLIHYAELRRRRRRQASRGHAASEILDGRALVRLAARWMTEHLPG